MKLRWWLRFWLSLFRLLVLDEMDQLDSKAQDVLYTIFEWPYLPNSRLCLIGIANALDLTDRILPRLRARPHCHPQLLHFPPYSREELVAIVQDRLTRVKREYFEASHRFLMGLTHSDCLMVLITPGFSGRDHGHFGCSILCQEGVGSVGRCTKSPGHLQVWIRKSALSVLTACLDQKCWCFHIFAGEPLRLWNPTRGKSLWTREVKLKVSSAAAVLCVHEGKCGKAESFSSSGVCSVEGQPSSGGPSALGGLRRPHGISRQRLRCWQLPPSAEAAGLLPAAAPTQRKDQRGRPGEGEMPPPVWACRDFTIWLRSCWQVVSVCVFFSSTRCTAACVLDGRYLRWVRESVCLSAVCWRAEESLH